MASCADPTPFLGTWQVSGSASGRIGTGASFRSVGGSSPEPRRDYAVTFSRGEVTDLESQDSRGCRLGWLVSGRAARSLPRQRCQVATARTTFTLLPETGEVVLTVVDVNHLSAVGKVTGSVEEGGLVLGRSEPAALELNGVLTRVPAPF